MTKQPSCFRVLQNRNLRAILLLAGACLLPGAIMLHLYAANPMEVSLRPVLTTAAFLSLLAMMIFTFAAFLFRSADPAFILSVATTVAIFAYRGFVVTVRNFMPHGVTLTYLLLGLLVAGGVGIWFRRKRYEFSKAPVIILFAVIATLFCLNLSKAVSFGGLETAGDFRTLRVEEELPSPDIYWMHCDGMLGFDAFNRYYADRQDDFRDFLQDNGFEINTAAQFEACHRTQCAVVCLMCPDYYDRILADRFATHEKATEFYRNSDVRATWELATRRLYRNELYHGFLAKGYRLRFLPEEPNFYLNYQPEEARRKKYLLLRDRDFLISVFDYFHRWLPVALWIPRETDPPGQVSPKELLPSWPEFIATSDYGKANANFLQELAQIKKPPVPTLTIINQTGAHAPFSYDENGNQTGDCYNTDPANYPAQHRFIARVIAANVKLILEADPDAVIVIQGDHGLHCTEAGQFRQRLGNDADPVELWNSVVSAVRIPAKYRNGEESHLTTTPLNITRYLVNAFVVSQNYDYL